MTKTITLFCGDVTRVSDRDYEDLIQLRWRKDIYNASGQPYVKATEIVRGVRTSVYMHRRITKAPIGMKVDHRDRDGLNNQRPNLRIASFHQNNANRAGFGSSGFKGVTRSGNIRNPWRARFTLDEKTFSLGQFATPEAAARAYDAVAFEAHGEFAYLNFPGEWPSTPHDSLGLIPFFEGDER